MNVKERILTIRLSEKIKNHKEFANKILSIEDKQSDPKPHQSKIRQEPQKY